MDDNFYNLASLGKCTEWNQTINIDYNGEEEKWINSILKQRVILGLWIKNISYHLIASTSSIRSAAMNGKEQKKAKAKHYKRTGFYNF